MTATAPQRVLPRRPPRLPANPSAQNTIMAADRTLMSWIRTALSMISFGFTIYKFLETVARQTPLAHPNSPRQVGLFLVALGTASMLLGTFSYWTTLVDLHKAEPFRLGRPVLWVGLTVSLGGAIMFGAVIRRLV